MKHLLISLLFAFSALAVEPPQTRPATAAEKAFLLHHMGEENLKNFGQNYAIESEIREAEFALMSLFEKDGSLSKKAAQGYIQHLTNRGYDRRAVEQRISGLMKGYFSNLQVESFASSVDGETKEDYEDRLEKAESNEEVRELEAELRTKLSDSKISKEFTKQNELKAEKLGNALLSAMKRKDYSPQDMPDPVSSSPEFYVPQDFDLAKYKKEISQKNQVLCERMPIKSISDEATQLEKQMSAVVSPSKKSGKGIQEIWIAWGYNRDWHSKSDAMFKTMYGDFTIHNAEGKDVPKKFGIYYFDPEKLSIPQYNIEIGVMFNDKWGMDLHMDHMKWKFDRLKDYKMTGDFSKKVWSTRGPRKTFEQAKADMDASWLRFEHSDGYNYISLGLIRNFKVFETESGNFDVDARVSAGAGAMVPRTDVRLYYQKDNGSSDRYGINNKFHIAGYGVHADARLKFTFWDRVFIQAAARGTRIKIENALVDGAGASLEHTPINSLQVIGQIGYQHKFNLNSKKKKKKKK